jgi:uncharacterized membrane protein YhaH (DUF805 family)
MLNFFFGFQGRIRRTNYFFGALVTMCLYSVLAVSGAAATGLIVAGDVDNLTVDFNPTPVTFAICGIVGLLSLWSMLALTVKRWHDVGMTGWFSILTLPPFANGVVFLLMCLLPGTTGRNRFGADPRGREAPSGLATA